MKILTICILVLSLALLKETSVNGQDLDSSDASRLPAREFKRIDIFPAISHSPETNLTLGAVGFLYFDLANDDQATPLSNVEYVGVYTLNQQIILETRWELFMNQSRWRSRGEAFFNRYPDRNYGMGNDAGVLIVEVDDEGIRDTLNYLNFNSDRIKFSPALLRQIRPNLYFGMQYNLESLYHLRIIPDQYYFINADSVRIQSLPVDGVRSGLGFQLLYDTRDHVLNPLKGSLVELSNNYYHRFLGSDYRFTTVTLHARQYINTIRNQTLALRSMGAMKFTKDEIPMRALSRVGGNKFIRGYFQGTFQDYHLTAFEVEYRLPLWLQPTDAKFWKIWKRLGLVGFISAAQVFHEPSDFQIRQFNVAVGGGMRILFNPTSRINLRIDYAIGLRRGPEAYDKRQSGFYFFLGEAF